MTQKSIRQLPKMHSKTHTSVVVPVNFSVSGWWPRAYRSAVSGMQKHCIELASEAVQEVLAQKTPIERFECLSRYVKFIRPNTNNVFVAEPEPATVSHMACGNSQQNNYYPDGLSMKDANIARKFKFSSTPKNFSLVFNNTLFYLDERHRITALCLETNTKLWRIQADQQLCIAAPCIYKYTLYYIEQDFQGLSEKLIGVDCVSGETVCEIEYELYDTPIRSDIIASRDRLFFSTDNRLFSVNPVDRTLKGVSFADAGPQSNLAYDSCFLYSGFSDNTLKKIDHRTLKVIKSVKAEGIATGLSIAQVQVYGDKVYVHSVDNRFYCYDKESMELLWSIRDFGFNIFTTQNSNVDSTRNFASAISDDIIVGLQDDGVTAISPQTGNFLWSIPKTHASPIIVGNQIILHQATGRLEVLDLNGTRINGDNIFASGASQTPLYENGSLVLIGKDGEISQVF